MRIKIYNHSTPSRSESDFLRKIKLLHSQDDLGFFLVVLQTNLRQSPRILKD